MSEIPDRRGPLSLELAERQSRRLLRPRSWDPELQELNALLVQTIDDIDSIREWSPRRAATSRYGRAPRSLVLAEWLARRLLSPRPWDHELLEMSALIVQAIDDVQADRRDEPPALQRVG